MFFRRKPKIYTTKPTNFYVRDRMGIVSNILGGTAAVVVAASVYPALGAPALIGGIIGFSAANIRIGMHMDFIHRRKIKEGKGSAFSRAFTKFWAKTPLYHLSELKVQNDLYHHKLEQEYKKIDIRINESTAEQRDAYIKDYKYYGRALNAINPNINLIGAAGGAFAAAAISRNVIMYSIPDNIPENFTVPSHVIPTNIASTVFSAIFCSVNLSLYAAKRTASPLPCPAFVEKADAYISKTPIESITQFFLRRSLNKLDKRTIGYEMREDILNIELDRTLEKLAQRARFSSKGSLRDIFNQRTLRDTEIHLETVLLAEFPPEISPALT